MSSYDLSVCPIISVVIKYGHVLVVSSLAFVSFEYLTLTIHSGPILRPSLPVFFSRSLSLSL